MAATPWAEEEEGNSGGWWAGEQKAGGLSCSPGRRGQGRQSRRPQRKDGDSEKIRQDVLD